MEPKPETHSAAAVNATVDWKQLNDEWESSSLSQEAFCRSKEVSYSTFVYYRGKKLQKRQHLDKSKFAPVRTIDVEKVSHNSVLNLQIPNGIRLEIPLDYNLTQLKKILEILGVAAC